MVAGYASPVRALTKERPNPRPDLASLAREKVGEKRGGKETMMPIAVSQQSPPLEHEPHDVCVRQPENAVMDHRSRTAGERRTNRKIAGCRNRSSRASKVEMSIPTLLVIEPPPSPAFQPSCLSGFTPSFPAPLLRESAYFGLLAHTNKSCFMLSSRNSLDPETI